jgi:hypothetical protein
MGSINSQQQADDHTKAEARKERMMLSFEDVKRLLQQDADARGKLADKSPEEWREWFDRMFQISEKERPLEDYLSMLEEDRRLARDRERLAREGEENEPT